MADHTRIKFDCAIELLLTREMLIYIYISERIERNIEKNFQDVISLMGGRNFNFSN